MCRRSDSGSHADAPQWPLLWGVMSALGRAELKAMTEEATVDTYGEDEQRAGSSARPSTSTSPPLKRSTALSTLPRRPARPSVSAPTTLLTAVSPLQRTPHDRSDECAEPETFGGGSGCRVWAPPRATARPGRPARTGGRRCRRLGGPAPRRAAGARDLPRASGGSAESQRSVAWGPTKGRAVAAWLVRRGPRRHRSSC